MTMHTDVLSCYRVIVRVVVRVVRNDICSNTVWKSFMLHPIDGRLALGGFEALDPGPRKAFHRLAALVP